MPLLLTDIIFHPRGYGVFDYRLLIVKDSIVGYLSKNGEKYAYQFGSRLLNFSFAKKILLQLKNFDNRLKNFKSSKNINNFSQLELIREWKKAEQVFMELGSLYRYCEQTVVKPLESVVLHACKHDGDLIQILKNPTLAIQFNFSSYQKQALYTLIQLGKLKYAIHSRLEPWVENIYKLAKVIAKRDNLTVEQVLALRHFEFLPALNGKLPSITELNKRLNGCVLMPAKTGRRWECLTGKEFKYWYDKLESVNNVDQITGIIAQRGIARGPVKIHLSVVKHSYIPKGSVLVCGMTNPQIVPMLKNAVAIITDEGGLTCHAAIISRELGIPCIVGAKIATKVLKDGDLVEVDAERGIVTKLQ